MLKQVGTGFVDKAVGMSVHKLEVRSHKAESNIEQGTRNCECRNKLTSWNFKIQNSLHNSTFHVPCSIFD